MGLKDSLVTMMGDFVQMNRNPDFRSKSDLAQPSQPSPTAEGQNRPAPRRHSLNITVGTDAESVRQRTFSITPEMQKHLEKINKRAMKKDRSTPSSATDVTSLRQRVDSPSDEDAALQYGRRQRRCSEPIVSLPQLSKEHKHSSRKSEHRSKDKAEDGKKSRRKNSETSNSRSRSSSRKHSVSNSRKSSGALKLKIDEEECDEFGNCRIIPAGPQLPASAARRLAAGCAGSGSTSARSSPTSGGTPATPIPEDWEAERRHAAEQCARASAGGSASMSLNPLAVELENIEKCRDSHPKSKNHQSKHHHATEKENDDGAAGRKASSASRKSSLSTYPPPAALLTNITRF